MKKRIIFLIVGLFLFLVLLFAGALIYVSQKVTPEDVKNITITKLQEIFPNSTVTLEDITYRLGLNIKLGLKNFSLATKHTKENVAPINMFRVDEVVVKIPLWAIIVGMGTVDVKIAKPQVTYKEFNKTNNWVYALGDNFKSNEKFTGELQNDQENKDNKEIAIPSIISKINLNLKLSDVKLDYVLSTGMKGDVLLSKIVLNNLGVNGPAAFEIASNLMINLNAKDKLSLNSLVIGELNLEELLRAKKVSTKLFIKVDNVAFGPMPNLLVPAIQTDVRVELNADGSLKGDISSSFNGHNKITANYSLEKDGISIHDINVSLLIKDLLSIISLKNEMLAPGDSLISLTGSIGLKDKKIIPDLNFKMEPGFKVIVAGTDIVKTANGKFKDDQLSISTNVKVLGGNVDSSVKGKIDINDKNFSVSKLGPFIVDVRASGVTLTESFVQGLLYPKNSTKAEDKTLNSENKEIGSKKAAVASFPVLLLPNVKIAINWSRIKVGENELKGNWDLNVEKNIISTKGMNFEFAKGVGKLTHQTTIKPEEIANSFKFDVTNLNLNGFRIFLPPFLKDVSGIVSAKVSGSADFKTNGPIPLIHDVQVDVSATKGELKGFDIGTKVKELIDNVSLLKGKIPNISNFNPDGNFESLDFAGRFQNELYNISKFNFIGVNKKVEVNGEGNIYPISKKEQSIFDLSVKDNAGILTPHLKKYAGTEILPMRLKGVGLVLNPDYSYTMEKLGKAAVKKNKDVVVKKAVEKISDKFLKNDEQKEKVKDALKSLFKK